MPEGADSGPSVMTPDEIEEKLEEGEFYEITYLSGKEEVSVLGKVDTLSPEEEGLILIDLLSIQPEVIEYSDIVQILTLEEVPKFTEEAESSLEKLGYWEE